MTASGVPPSIAMRVDALLEVRRDACRELDDRVDGALHDAAAVDLDAAHAGFGA